MSRLHDIADTLIRRGSRKRLRRLLEKHLELRHDYGESLVFHVLWWNRGLLKGLLERGVSPNRLPDVETWNTPLMHAASAGYVAEMRLLLEHGADPYALNEAGENALGYACSWQHPEAIRLLVAAGVDVNDTTDSGPERTQLDWAEMSGWTEVADTLRELGGRRFAELEGT